MRPMRTTVDIPDDLFRRAKSEAALRGRKLRDLIVQGLSLALAASPNDGESTAEPARKPSMHDLAKDLIFEGVDSPPDLSTNKKYFDDFGR
jgi:hypothetical protein